MTRAQCRMDHMFSCKHLTVTLLGTSPGWSLGPAGLRVREPCLTPSHESCHSLPEGLHPAAPSATVERFALGSWPNNAVRVSSPHPNHFSLLISESTEMLKCVGQKHLGSFQVEEGYFLFVSFKSKSFKFWWSPIYQVSFMVHAVCILRNLCLL